MVKTCIVNDRGIHICKSMIAWQLFANGATPDSTNKKGDHFVGDYYVKYNDAFKLLIDLYNNKGNDIVFRNISRISFRFIVCYIYLFIFTF